MKAPPPHSLPLGGIDLNQLNAALRKADKRAMVLDLPVQQQARKHFVSRGLR